MSAAVPRQAAVAGAAVAVAVACGYAVARSSGLALLLAVAVGAVVALIVLGPRAFPCALVVVAVVPWYRFTNDLTGPPLVGQKLLCAAIVAAPLAPWLWALGTGPTRRRPSARVGLYGLTFVGLAIAIHETLGSLTGMVNSGTVGLLVGGIAFVAARRFPDARAWGAAATLGVTVLVLMGLAASVIAPGARVGFFSGYPITYGALVVGLLPPALVWLSGRSRALAAALGAGACAMLILSQSRSSWIACIAVMAVVVALLFRQRRWRALRAVGGLVLVTSIVVVSTGSLNAVVERRLSPDVRQSDSVTHRAWSYGYAVRQISERPVFGAGRPGYAADQAAEQTGIGALDNGYLSILVDSGLFGFTAVFVPIALALVLVGRWFWRRETPRPEALGLALGVLAIAVVTIFYDSFYWAQLSVLIFAMGGALSAQAAGALQRRPTSLPRALRGALAPIGASS